MIEPAEAALKNAGRTIEGRSVKQETEIYMPLLDEGVDCWRPVRALARGGNLYEVLGPMPDGEVWRYAPGSIVHCESKAFEDGSHGLLAVSNLN